MTNTIKSCSCGSTKFFVMESYAYKMELIEGGLFNTSHADGGLDTISCEKCSKEYSEDDFNEINWD